MRTIQGPGIFLAQFIGDAAPFDTLDGLAGWAAGLGFKAVQLPTNLPHIFDLGKAAASQTYADEIRGLLAGYGLAVSELSTHLQGQLVAVHPVYNEQFDVFAPASVHGNEGARRDWAVEQLKLAARASRNLGLTAHATFSGALAWPFFYPWPQRPAGLIEEAFRELAGRWLPILNAFDEAGADVCFELHPGEDRTTGRALSASWSGWAIIRAPGYFTIRATWCFSSWITSSSWTIITRWFAPSTSRMRSSGPAGEAAYTPATRTGLTGPDASDPLAMGRWISRLSSASWPSTTTPDGL